LQQAIGGFCHNFNTCINPFTCVGVTFCLQAPTA
jgi:hypothetical protein